MLGFEIEVDVPVMRGDGESYDSGHKLADCATEPGYEVVTDIEDTPDGESYSIFEFVSHPVFVVGASHATGREVVAQQLSGIKDVAGKLAAAKRGPLTDLGGELVLDVDDDTNPQLRPDFNPDTVDTLGVHYSTGLPLSGMATFFRKLRGVAPVLIDEKRPHNTRDRFNLAQAELFAAGPVAAFSGGYGKSETDHGRRVLRQLDGYLQLAYMQICALADGCDYSADGIRPLLKNLTAVLCRAPLAQVVEQLDADASFFLASRVKDNFERLKEFQAKPEPEYPRAHVFRGAVKLQEVGNRTLEDVALGLLGGTLNVDPRAIFGGMTVVPGHNELDAFVIPVELRSLGNEDKTWDEVGLELGQLCVWSDEAYRER